MASFTEGDMRALLLKVGLNPVPANALERTFADLELDSLARIEIATRLRESFGTDVEVALTNGDDLTPCQVVSMVNNTVTKDSTSAPQDGTPDRIQGVTNDSTSAPQDGTPDRIQGVTQAAG